MVFVLFINREVIGTCDMDLRFIPDGIRLISAHITKGSF